MDLVVGATGLLGAQICRRLCDRGEEIVKGDLHNAKRTVEENHIDGVAFTHADHQPRESLLGSHARKMAGKQ